MDHRQYFELLFKYNHLEETCKELKRKNNELMEKIDYYEMVFYNISKTLEDKYNDAKKLNTIKKMVNKAIGSNGSSQNKFNKEFMKLSKQSHEAMDRIKRSGAVVDSGNSISNRENEEDLLDYGLGEFPYGDFEDVDYSNVFKGGQTKLNKKRTRHKRKRHKSKRKKHKNKTKRNKKK